MAEYAKVRITGGPAGYQAKVELDGVDISDYVDRVEFVGSVHELFRVTLHLPAVEIEIDAEAAVAVVIERRQLMPDDEGMVETTTLGDHVRQFRPQIVSD